MMNSSVFFQGMGLCASLIMAIGAQNAFVLRQGITRQYIFVAAITCVLCDFVLMAAGMLGMGKMLQMLPGLQAWMALGGALFVWWFGWGALQKAFRPTAMQLDTQTEQQQTTKSVILAALGFSLLNPHAILDTVVLVGGIGAQQAPANQPMFLLGAVSFSCLWFFSLAFGASKLAPLFARPLAWRILDGLIALMMGAIGLSLLRLSGFFPFLA
ncbi:LysE/ArgO family amino acid transporter [Chitinibacter tainanensis]|jgi:L-lysine exporter family protein LysE/ArgO|uniref:LysE/ArgO family amino acid transporter n=1 Tax=Chitinibacter tainanensis TaxID=230667 RepID=UPI00041C2907|nr:LysE/ArgO family amino acid transporter [Chitinibacter tainanensis]